MKLTQRFLAIILTCAVLFISDTSSAATYFKNAELVKISSVFYHYPPSNFRLQQAKENGVPVEVKIERSIEIPAYLIKPEGRGPYPAIVLLHSCAGITEHEEIWADRLAGWGYVVLTVDSFTPREITGCDGTPHDASPWIRTLDAFGAKSYLSSLPFVDLTRIAVMGISHGGSTVLEIIKQATNVEIAMTPFQASVALYPLCGEPAPADTPVLILIGQKDDWTPADHCILYFEKLKTPHSVALKVFPNAHHLFDYPDIDTKELGYTLRSDKDAAAEAIQMTQDFLSEQL